MSWENRLANHDPAGRSLRAGFSLSPPSLSLNRIACPVPACAYDVPLTEFRASLTEVLTELCPDCAEPLVRKTKDLESQHMGWVGCPVCPFEMSYRDFRAGLTP